MSDFEARSHRAAAAMRREADGIADTDAVLAQIKEGSTVTALEPRAGRHRRRQLLAVSALAAGAAAALVGVAVIVNDDEAVIEPPATEPPVPSTVVQPTTNVIETTPTAPPSTSPSLPTSPAPSTGSTTPEDWTPTQPPPPDPPAEDSVPYLIAVQVSDLDTRYRVEPGWAPRNEGKYVQAFSNADGSRSLYVQTTSPRPDVIVEPIPGTIGPWELFDGSGEYDGLTLAHGDISVALDSNWLGLDQLRALAAQLGPRADGGPGWDLGAIPGGVEPVGEGYWWIGDTRSALLVDPEGRAVSQLDVTTGVEGGMGFPLAPYLPDPTQEIVDFDGKRALFSSTKDLTWLYWEYEPGVYVKLWSRYEWTPRQFVRHARSVVTESREMWDNAAPLPPGEGCQTFSC